MKDKRNDKVHQHFDVFFNDQKFKVIALNIHKADGILSIKTKIFGQDFPHNGNFTITVPSQNIKHDLTIAFHSMRKSPSVEHWEYTIRAE